MKILMMSAWNQTSGVCIHAELVGEEWVKAGHELKVFSFLEDDFHGACLIGVDQEYVIRCFGTPGRTNYLDPIPFLKEDYDFFVVQNLELMPMAELLKIWPQIKAKAKTILVIHEGYLPPYPEFYQFDFDAIVCFDERYQRELEKKFPPDKIDIVPYPCHPLEPGDKREARERLGLPQDKKILFSYGLVIHQHFSMLLPLEDLSQRYPLVYLALTAEGRSEILDKAQDRYSFIQIREGGATVEELYDYLHASDVLLLYKQSFNIVVPSTVYLCLGSGCPIVILGGRYTEELGEEVLKYRDFDELKEVLAGVFEGRKPDQKAVEKFIAEKSAGKVAQRFIELFESL